MNTNINSYTGPNRDIAEVPIAPGQDEKPARATHVNLRNSLPHREFPIQNPHHVTYPQAVHGRRWTENRQYALLRRDCVREPVVSVGGPNTELLERVVQSLLERARKVITSRVIV